MRGYMSKNTKNNHNAAGALSVHIAQSIDFDQMSSMQEKYFNIITQYANTPNLSVLSTLKLDMLDEAKEWIEEIRTNKSFVLPFLISNMLRGDIYALNIYDKVYQNKPSLLVDYTTIHNDDSVQCKFNDYGGAEDARAIVTAEHWLTSEDAVEILGSTGKDSLCGINGMLGIENTFLEC